MTDSRLRRTVRAHTLVRFELSRIQLAPFTTKDRYKQGYSDFPADVLEKVYSKTLAKYVPARVLTPCMSPLEYSRQVCPR